MLIRASIAIGVFAAASFGQQLTVGQVDVQGVSRIPASAVVSFTGLKPGKTVTGAQLKEICQRLVDSGFFTSARYAYAPANGRYRITIALEEEKVTTAAVIDIDGVNGDEAWAKARETNPLILPVMPDNDMAQSAYEQALMTVLGKKHLDFSREAVLGTSQRTVIIRDGDRPKLTKLIFEGNKGLDSDKLEEALDHIVVGQPYSQRELVNIVNLNLRMVYDRAGYLQATFPKVERANPGEPEVTARITVDEGIRWKLGKVDFDGAPDLPSAEMLKRGDFPVGKVVNWDYIVAANEKAQRVLMSKGYLHVQTNPERIFHNDTAVVDLLIHVNKGQQFRFGDLLIAGVDVDKQDRISRRFALKPGSPVDGEYTMMFPSEIYPIVGKHVQNINMSYVPHSDDASVLDVKYEIR